MIVTDLSKFTAEDTLHELKKESKIIFYLTYNFLMIVVHIDPTKIHSAFQVDVASKESVEHLASGITKLYGKPPSSVIHCAGIFGHVVDSETCPEKSFQIVTDVNVKGTFLINTIFAKLMKENGIAGAIVNLSSVAKDGFACCLPYATSKAGIVGITKTIAQEFGPNNVRCNAVAPGAIDTPMGRDVPAANVKKYLEMCALNRVGRPEEIASICVFLASDASSYVNGIVLEAHGGRMIC